MTVVPAVALTIKGRSPEIFQYVVWLNHRFSYHLLTLFKTFANQLLQVLGIHFSLGICLDQIHVFCSQPQEGRQFFNGIMSIF